MNMINIIDWIIEQEFKSLDDYPCLALPLSKQFKIDISTSQLIIETVIEWETETDTKNSLEDLLIKRFPDIVT